MKLNRNFFVFCDIRFVQNIHLTRYECRKYKLICSNGALVTERRRRHDFGYDSPDDWSRDHKVTSVSAFSPLTIIFSACFFFIKKSKISNKSISVDIFRHYIHHAKDTIYKMWKCEKWRANVWPEICLRIKINGRMFAATEAECVWVKVTAVRKKTYITNYDDDKIRHTHTERNERERGG